jgi:hypothetical protein
MPDVDKPLLTGSCMCGAVRFEVTAPLLGALYCHCRRCQHRTGTAFSVSNLTEDPGVRPSVHQFVDYAAPWAPVPDDGLPASRSG